MKNQNNDKNNLNLVFNEEKQNKQFKNQDIETKYSFASILGRLLGLALLIIIIVFLWPLILIIFLILGFAKR